MEELQVAIYEKTFWWHNHFSFGIFIDLYCILLPFKVDLTFGTIFNRCHWKTHIKYTVVALGIAPVHAQVSFLKDAEWNFLKKPVIRYSCF